MWTRRLGRTGHVRTARFDEDAEPVVFFFSKSKEKEERPKASFVGAFPKTELVSTFSPPLRGRWARGRTDKTKGGCDDRHFGLRARKKDDMAPTAPRVQKQGEAKECRRVKPWMAVVPPPCVISPTKYSNVPNLDTIFEEARDDEEDPEERGFGSFRPFIYSHYIMLLIWISQKYTRSKKQKGAEAEISEWTPAPRP
ncbi:hypothetical protein H6P81_019533 [Aristolochia fimbriata]|uniref:Uncharacterized protein n=1 Tax=Aristolochia fimbriata TaxID=158543 RepID=A0AAV7DWM2_ARIFI|nr:hypothetical protein H6P81_019533 [Aristolochia fimbriata]